MIEYAYNRFICVGVHISIYVCYSQGDGFNTFLSRIFYLILCTQLGCSW